MSILYGLLQILVALPGAVLWWRRSPGKAP
jgi:uncharacterized iron-regulated membrane protein